MEGKLPSELTFATVFKQHSFILSTSCYNVS